MLFLLSTIARESHGGQRLIRKADFNAGSHINSMFRVRCKLYDPSSDKRMTGAPEKRHITYFGRFYKFLSGHVEFHGLLLLGNISSHFDFYLHSNIRWQFRVRLASLWESLPTTVHVTERPGHSHSPHSRA